MHCIIEAAALVIEKCPYSEISGPHFPAFGLNTEQKNSKYGHFSHSGFLSFY